MKYIFANNAIEATAIAAQLGMSLRTVRMDAIWISERELLRDRRLEQGDEIVIATNWSDHGGSRNVKTMDVLSWWSNAVLDNLMVKVTWFDVEAMELMEPPPSDLNDLEAVEKWLAS